ncbi:MAG: FtsQ-type POTRA domain-containing protein [Spirochaetales bacterium]|nr:FtsQ-type POTRA domain-containing protein [Spirochaetales bacterium]
MSIAALLYYASAKFCVVSKIELNKDFNVDTEKLYDFLDIEDGKFIWEYSAAKLNDKLATQTYLDEYNVKIKFPNTISIYMRIRVPVARIVMPDSTVAYTDKNGLVFKESNYSGHLPLLIINKKSTIFSDKKLNAMPMKLVNVLTELKSRYPDIYNSVSQVDAAEYGKIDTHYIISYSGINKKTYLKNQINVDLIREGLVAALFLEGTASPVNTAFYSGIGFVY